MGCKPKGDGLETAQFDNLEYFCPRHGGQVADPVTESIDSGAAARLSARCPRPASFAKGYLKHGEHPWAGAACAATRIAPSSYSRGSGLRTCHTGNRLIAECAHGEHGGRAAFVTRHGPAMQLINDVYRFEIGVKIGRQKPFEGALLEFALQQPRRQKIGHPAKGASPSLKYASRSFRRERWSQTSRSLVPLPSLGAGD